MTKPQARVILHHVASSLPNCQRPDCEECIAREELREQAKLVLQDDRPGGPQPTIARTGSGERRVLGEAT